MIVGAAPPERSGAAAAIAETGSELGGALGIALLGVVGNSIYRGQIAGALPAGISRTAAGAAHDTLTGAVTAAGQLHGPVRATLLDTARQAFTYGLHAVVGVCAAIAIGVAILDAVMLRRTVADPGSFAVIA
jgi:DHA2 family multidrug resistance protein-like MFS transporter